MRSTSARPFCAPRLIAGAWVAVILAPTSVGPLVAQDAVDQQVVAPADVSLADYARHLEAAAIPDDFVIAAGEKILEQEGSDIAARQVGEGSKASGSGLRMAEAAFTYVSRRVAALEDPGGLPRLAADVLRAGEGDVGEKHALFSALLRAFPAEEDRPRAEDASRRRAEVLPVFVSDRLLTLVRVAEAEVWLDLSSAVAPFGYLPP